MRHLRMILITFLTLSITLVAFGTALAKPHKGQIFSVTITNLTKKQVFSPPLVVSHQKSIQLYELGQPASDGIVAIAEGGNTAPLVAVLGTLDKVLDYAMGGGAIAPGESMTLRVQAHGRFNRISILSMLTSTNDAFVGVNSTSIPYFGTKSLNAVAYDAGSEKNTELCSDLPGKPCAMDSGNARVPAEAEGFIYVHNGIHGVGDLFAPNMTWQNPVARVMIERMN